MYSDINTISILPREIQIYKEHVINQSDPIKREVFNYSFISYITKLLEPFPVNYKYLYGLNSIKHMLHDIALSYIEYKQVYSNFEYFCNNKEELSYVINFIKLFYDTLLPIKDKEISDLVWIYPKLSIKCFVAQNFFESNFNSYYYNEEILKKFIILVSEFSQYELDEININTSYCLDKINYPTLILANIGLYEKGFIKFKDENNNKIGIYLDLESKSEELQIFSKDKLFLKKAILNIINKISNSNYLIKDFL